MERETDLVKGKTYKLSKKKTFFYKESVVYPFVQFTTSKKGFFLSTGTSKQSVIIPFNFTPKRSFISNSHSSSCFSYCVVLVVVDDTLEVFLFFSPWFYSLLLKGYWLIFLLISFILLIYLLKSDFWCRVTYL